MGYSHYWYTKPNLNETNWKQFAIDCKKLFAFAHNEMGIALADGSGEAETQPQITREFISFNGSEAQPSGLWTTNENISLPWPSSTASLSDESADPTADKTNGTWFAGDLVEQRVAPIDNLSGFGSGSYETCGIDRVKELSKYNDYTERDAKYGLAFDCCKTAYRPYDLVVTAVLIALKHNFGNDVIISTDGEEKDWLDARMMCNNVLGYGLSVVMDFEETKEQVYARHKDRIAAIIADKKSEASKKEAEKTAYLSQFEKADRRKTTALIKKHILKTWPTVTKVEVRSDSFSGGDSIDVTYFAPSEIKELKEFINSFAYGRFNGYDDSYEYNREDLPNVVDGFILQSYKYAHCYFKLCEAKQPEIKEEVKPATPSQLKLVDYSEKAVALFGNTKPIKDALKAIGGRFNPFLTLEGEKVAGWIFSKTKIADVQKLIAA